MKQEVTSAVAGIHVGPLSGSNWNLEMLVFVNGRKPENPEKKPRSKARTNIWHRTLIEPGSHWWEAKAFTRAPTLLPRYSDTDIIS